MSQKMEDKAQYSGIISTDEGKKVTKTKKKIKKTTANTTDTTTLAEVMGFAMHV